MSDITEDEAPGPIVMDLLLHLQREADAWLAGRNIAGWSYAVYVTDGAKPGAGTIVSVRAGRYADGDQADVLNPDEQAAYEQRQAIARAIADWYNERDPLLNEQIEDLTDDIVAALAGE